MHSQEAKCSPYRRERATSPNREYPLSWRENETGEPTLRVWRFQPMPCSERRLHPPPSRPSSSWTQRLPHTPCWCSVVLSSTGHSGRINRPTFWRFSSNAASSRRISSLPRFAWLERTEFSSMRVSETKEMITFLSENNGSAGCSSGCVLSCGSVICYRANWQVHRIPHLRYHEGKHWILGKASWVRQLPNNDSRGRDRIVGLGRNRSFVAAIPPTEPKKWRSARRWWMEGISAW